MNNQYPSDLSQEVQDIWNQNAAFWDDYMGEGNDFHLTLISPAVERLLELKPDEQMLEVACGNGQFARRLANLGANVVACDFSEVFIERARARKFEKANRIEYHAIDATNRAQLLSLGQRRFDAIVCNMAFMDMVAIDPLLEAASLLLKPGGRFIFSVTHPCFNSIGMSKIVEEIDREGELVTQYAIKIWSYLTPVTQKGLGIIGQPAPHYYFHRPINMLFNHCFRAGFVIDGLEEPVFPPRSQANRPFSWANFNETPPALVVRLRLPA